MRDVISRSRLWALLPGLALLASGIPPAHAAAQTIANGQTRTGTITGTNSDSYTFSVPAGGGSFVVSVAEIGPPDPDFVPEIDITAPGTGAQWSSVHPLYASFVQTDGAAEGTWTVRVSRKDGGQSVGGYALSLVQVPGASGRVLTSGAGTSGTNERGQLGVWTFTGVAGRTETLSLNVTSGNDFVPEALVFSPSGSFAGGCGATCSHDVPIKTSGTWTVVVRKTDGNDVTGAYTLSVNDKR